MPDQIIQKVTGALQQGRAWLLRQPRAFLMGGVAVGAILLWLLYVPPMAAIRRSGAQWEKVKKEAIEARRAVDPLRRGEIVPLPKTDALPAILEQLTTLARSHQIQLIQCTPAVVRPTESAGLVVLPVELLVEGEYRPIGEFLGSLSQTPSLGPASIRRISFDRDERLLPRLRGRLSLEVFLSELEHGS